MRQKAGSLLPCRTHW